METNLPSPMTGRVYVNLLEGGGFDCFFFSEWISMGLDHWRILVYTCIMVEQDMVSQKW